MEDLFKDFGSKVFGEKEMKSRLPRPVYLSWKKTVANEGMLDRITDLMRLPCNETLGTR